MAGRSIAAGAVVALAAGISTWVLASSGLGHSTSTLPPHDTRPSWTLAGPDANARRRDALQRASVFIDARRPSLTSSSADNANADLTCRFVPEIPTGTSAKFSCALDDGEIVKVKYGRNPEIQAEVAATHLLSRLGFAADDVRIVRRVRCYGCARYPFARMQLLWTFGSEEALARHASGDGFTDFEWVAVERKFPAPPIETSQQKGWAWWELKPSADRADVDALRLIAVFLAHWDNKAENQRLVCLDATIPSNDGSCAVPLLMIQDLGATFGPFKVNLARWHDAPIWSDRRGCTATMRTMPYAGGTFTDVTISEAARQRVGRALAMLPDHEVRQLFRAARFPEHYTATDDEEDLREWTATFRHRVDQILRAGPCP